MKVFCASDVKKASRLQIMAALVLSLALLCPSAALAASVKETIIESAKDAAAGAKEAVDTISEALIPSDKKTKTVPPLAAPLVIADKGIVLTLFGSSDPAVEAVITDFAAKVRAAYPSTKVSVAYTAQRAREAMRARGLVAPSLAQALASLPEDNIHTAVVQSLHIMPGYEFHDSMRVGQAMTGLPKGLKSVHVGTPLISNAQELDKVAQILLDNTPKRGPAEAVVFVGHGTDHMGGLAYPALQYALSQRDAHAFVSALGGSKFAGPAVPSTEQTMQALAKAQIKKVYLVPLMTVAGVHVKEDITGTGADSWTSMLKKKGFEVQEVRKGLLEIPAIQDLFIARIGEALKN